MWYAVYGMCISVYLKYITVLNGMILKYITLCIDENLPDLSGIPDF